MSAGIDYGMGLTNIDPTNGIRYGVISQHSLSEYVIGEAEPLYGPLMGYCEAHGEYPAGPDDSEDDKVPCPACGAESRVSSGDEPIGHDYTPNDKDYQTEQCLDSDVIVTRSPYFTIAQYCSPCVPGAGNLDHPIPDGVRTYAFGHDFFEDDIAPYPLYRVSDGSEVIA